MDRDGCGEHFGLFGELALVNHQTPVGLETSAPLPSQYDQRKSGLSDRAREAVHERFSGGDAESNAMNRPTARDPARGIMERESHFG